MNQRIKNKQLIVTTPFDLNDQRIYNLGTPTGATDAVNKDYVDVNALNISLGSGLFSGGFVTIVDATHFAVSSGVGYIVDSINKTSTQVVFSSKSGETLMTMGATDITVSIAIDINGNVIQQIPVFSSQQRRHYIVLGELYRDPLSHVLSLVWFKPIFSWDTSTFVDAQIEQGAKSYSGNFVTPNGANLSLDVSGGVIHGYSVNAIRSYESPNYSSFSGITAFNFLRSYHNGTEWIFQTPINVIEPQYYSNGTANLQTLANNKWSTRLIGRGSINGEMVVIYPTQLTYYTDATEAKADLQNLTMILPDEFHKDVVPLVFLIVQGNATDLSNPIQAQYVPIQSLSVTAGGSLSVLATDVSFDNSGVTNITSTNVQTTLVEINNKIENLNYTSNINMAANSGVSGIYLACNTGITITPATRVRVFINSIEIPVGNGTTSSECFFSSNGGVTAKSWTNVASGDLLYWNGSVAPFQLEATDGISFEYLTL